MKKEKLITFYRDEMVYGVKGGDGSKSPHKPRLLLEYLQKHDLHKHLEIKSDFEPFTKEEFLLAHTPEYVSGFFEGREPHCNCHDVLGIEWTEEFANSVCYTNASLYHAIRYSIDNPESVTFSPTSGFHHAMPEHGSLFCAFSGQVIASTLIYRELGLSGAYIDLDGHYGNSIEDSRDFVEDLKYSIPKGWNVNLRSKHGEYLENLSILLGLLKQEILNNKIHYVVFCHGADSHEYDDIGNQLTTEEWIGCSNIFYQWVNDVEAATGKPLPVSLSLFGGYRDDDFESVLSLHTADLVKCLNILAGHNLKYQEQVKPRQKV